MRAIAVLAVVAFHAFPGVIPGGFIGVDVFFVISGFLITTIILTNIEQDRFTITEFYRRRILRIFPALITVLSATLFASTFLLLDDEFKFLGKHVAGGASFISNFLLWQESGYFDNAADTKPLLHLWSLAIEEQFYIFWPVFLLIAWKRKWRFTTVILMIAVASFALNVYQTHDDPNTAFYSPLSRFWELMVGGLLAYVIRHRPELVQHHENVQALIGCALLAIGLASISEQRDFPGWWALLPTIGTFLVISAGPHALPNRTVLSNGVMVWIGKISYPLYLWHWPLLSLARITETTLPSRGTRLTLVAASILLAWLTFQYIERPFRSGVRRSRNSPLILIVSMIGCLAIGALIATGTLSVTDSRDDLAIEVYRTDWQYTPKCLETHGPTFRPSFNFRNDFCIESKPDAKRMVFVIGDSHANRLYLGLQDLSPETNFINLGKGSCPPIIDSGPTEPKLLPAECTLTTRAIIDTANKSTAETIFVHGFTGRFLDMRTPDRTARLARAMADTLTLLSSTGKQVVLILDTPELRTSPRACVRRVADTKRSPESLPECRFDRRLHDARVRQFNDTLTAFVTTLPNLRIFDPTNVLCDQKFCYAAIGAALYYTDVHHLSSDGARLVAHAIDAPSR